MEEQELHHLFIAIMDYVIDTTKKIQTNTINSVELGLQIEIITKLFDMVFWIVERKEAQNRIQLYTNKN